MSSAVPDMIQSGLALHNQGRLDEAEKIYRDVLRLDGRNFDALHLLGVLAYHHGRHEQAVELISMAIRVNPDIPFAYTNRGNALKILGRHGEALASYARAAQLNPGDADAHANMAMALEEMGRFVEALASYDKFIALKPDVAEAYLKRGNTLKSLKRPDEALNSYAKAIAIRPDFAEAHSNRGNTLKELGRLEEAVASFAKAIEYQPGFAELYSNLGNTLHEMERFDEAVSNFDTAIRLKPSYAEAWYNRGLTLKALQRFDEAIASFKSAADIKPEYADAILNRSFVELLTANFREGWKNYEARPQSSIAGLGPRLTTLEQAAGKTVLVHWEQGLGDTMQFCRYLPMLQERGANVLFAPQPSLKALLNSFDGGLALTDPGSQAFDFYIPLLSLPGLFGTVLETIPARHGYLSADPARVPHWKEKIGSGGFKVGVCWTANAVRKENLSRAFPADSFQQLAGIANVRLISLVRSQDCTQPLPAAIEVLDGLDAGADAFADTAAVMMNLDLVITSDTSIGHLAGALGVPTWLALKQVPDWRWLTERTDSPWYPNIRLFRQKTHGDWNNVFLEMKNALTGLAGAGPG